MPEERSEKQITVIGGPMTKTVESLGKKFEVPVDEKDHLVVVSSVGQLPAVSSAGENQLRMGSGDIMAAAEKAKRDSMVVGTATPLPPPQVEQAPTPPPSKPGPKHGVMSFPHPLTGKPTSLGQILFDIVAERERAKQIVHDGELAFEARFKKFERILDDLAKAIDKRNDDVGTIISNRCETMNKSIRDHIASQIIAVNSSFSKDRERVQEAAKRVDASCATVSAFNGKFNLLDNGIKQVNETLKLTPQLVDERLAEKLKPITIQLDRLDKGKVDKRKG